MQAKVKQLADKMCEAIGPIMMEQPEVNSIIQASSILLARISQGCSSDEIDPIEVQNAIKSMADEALKQLIELENAKKAQKEVMELGIAGFTEFSKPSGAPPEENIVNFLNKEAARLKGEEEKEDSDQI